jgi:nitroreductase
MNSRINPILARRSIRKYTSKPVSEEDVKNLLEAAMAAPSASNRKPWHFIIIREKEMLNALGNLHPYGKMLFETSVCICICGDRSISEMFWVQDCSAASENLLLAATFLGLGAVWLGVHPREERSESIRNLLNLPENIVPLNMISIGHPAVEKKPRTQFDGTRVHKEKW